MGGDGDDNVQGSSSNDIVSGNAGINTLTGGPGNDIFVCGPGGGDRITDFQPGQDLRFGSYIPAAAPTPTQPPAPNFLNVGFSFRRNLIKMFLDSPADGAQRSRIIGFHDKASMLFI